MGKKVAIVGKAATAASAPYEDESWEIWGLAWVRYPRQTYLFDIHHPDFKEEPPYDGHENCHSHPKYKEWVDKIDCPVVCDPEATIFGDKAVPYPLDEVKAYLPKGFDYLDCSVSYMLALAMTWYHDLEEIGLYGCNFLTKHEFRDQVPSVAYLIGLAVGAGIKVHSAPGSTLLMSPYAQGRYGVDHGCRWGRRFD